jgi:hypothetical protein
MKDYTNYDQAVEQARELRKFWLQKGYRVDTEIIPTENKQCGCSIRSNMLNGLPRGYKA